MRPLFFFLVVLALPIFAAGGRGAEGQPAEASASAARTFEAQARESIQGLGYPDGVFADFMRMVGNWGCDSWKQQLDRARQNYRQKKASATEVAQIEEQVARSLYEAVRRDIKQLPADSDYFYLSKVVKDKKAQCLGTCQVLYVVGNSVGLQVKVVEVSVANTGRLPPGVGNVACLVELTGGRAMMVDPGQEFASKPFVFRDEFQAAGNFFELKRKDNPWGIHRKIRVLDRNGLLGMIYLDLAKEYFNAGRNDQTIRLLNKAVELDPKSDAAFACRGAVRGSAGQHEKAISDCNKAIELNPRSAEAFMDRGNVFYALRQSLDAISDYSKAIDLNPENSIAYMNRGNVYRATKQYLQAIMDYTKAVELNPKDVMAYNSRGVAYDASGQPAKAVSDYTRAIELDPKNVQAYYGRACAYGALRQYDDSISDSTKAIELNPKLAGAYVSRGLGNAVLGNADDAKQDFKKALELNPALEENIKKISEQFKLGP